MANGVITRLRLGLLLGMHLFHMLHVASAVFRVCPSCVYLFTAAYGTSIGPIGWVLPNEVFPLSMRGKGAAVSAASNWLNNCNVRNI